MLYNPVVPFWIWNSNPQKHVHRCTRRYTQKCRYQHKKGEINIVKMLIEQNKGNNTNVHQ